MQDQFPRFSDAFQQYKAKIVEMKASFPEMFRPFNLKEINCNQPRLPIPSWENDLVMQMLKKMRRDIEFQRYNKEKLEKA